MTVEHSSKTQKKVKCSYVAHFGTPNLLFLKQSFFFFCLCSYRRNNNSYTGNMIKIDTILCAEVHNSNWSEGHFYISTNLGLGCKRPPGDIASTRTASTLSADAVRFIDKQPIDLHDSCWNYKATTDENRKQSTAHIRTIESTQPRYHQDPP